MLSAACRGFGFPKGSTTSSDTIRESLQWLEKNPPDAIHLPKAIQIDGDGAVAFRDKGNAPKEKTKVLPGAAVCYTSYPEDDCIEWCWESNPPQGVAQCLNDVCAEIPYLGEACSLASICAEERPQVSLADMRDSQLFVRDDMPDMTSLYGSSEFFFTCPAEGHLDELLDVYKDFHKKNYEGRQPEDYDKTGKAKSDPDQERNLLAALPKWKQVRPVAYHSAVIDEHHDSSKITAPWNRAIILPVNLADGGRTWTPRQREVVAWAVGLHRLLVKKWGFDVPAELTGKYLRIPGVSRPANNVAIHVLAPSLKESVFDKLNDGIRECLPAFLVLIPPEMSSDDFARLCDICASLQGQAFYCRRDWETLTFGEAQVFDDADIWQRPMEGRTRYWKPFPFAIAETRAFSDPHGGRNWRAAETVALSVAHVWRDAFAAVRVPQTHVSKEREYWNLADSVLSDESPVSIINAHPVSRVHITDYVHHVQASNIVRAVDAFIRFDGKSSDVECAAMALGQTRHLGGGLLVPIDIPNDLISRDSQSGKEEPLWLN